MTTKWKVIGGFLVMMCLLVAVAALGYMKLHEASMGFAAYRVEARTSVAANGADALMRGAWDRLSRFQLDLDEKHIKEAHAMAERAVTYYLDKARKLETDPTEQAVLDKQVERITQSGQFVDEMAQKLTAATKMLDEQLTVASRETTAEMREMSAIARKIDNDSLLELIEEAFARYSNARVYVRYYVDMFIDSAANKAEEEIAAAAAALKKMESVVVAPENKQHLAKLQQRLGEYAASFKTIRTLIEGGLKAAQQIDALGVELNREFDGYTGRAETRMDTIGPAV